MAIEPIEPLPPTHVEPSNLADPAGPALDAGVVASLTKLGEDVGEDLSEQMAVLFLADADARIVAMREGVARNDAAAVIVPAHSLGGASAMLGATLLAGLCNALATECAAGQLVDGEALLETVEAELERVRVALDPPAPTP